MDRQLAQQFYEDDFGRSPASDNGRIRLDDNSFAYLESMKSKPNVSRNDSHYEPPKWISPTSNQSTISYPKVPSLARDVQPQLPPKVSATSHYPEPLANQKHAENGEPLRRLILPDNITARFEAMALPNTKINIETCGVLGGVLERNTFTVTHVFLPPQVGTDSSCTTTDEMPHYEYMFEHDLIELGWIHTHPTQTCFLSSIDMHTQANTQGTLAEAVAIVCAPSLSQSEVFRLTNPPGLPTIKACRQPGGQFHSHEERNLYTQAAHVSYVSGLGLEIKDFRNYKERM